MHASLSLSVCLALPLAEGEVLWAIPLLLALEKERFFGPPHPQQASKQQRDA